MAIGGILYKNHGSPNALTGTSFRVAFRSSGSSTEGAGGDSVNFSSETLSRLSSRIAKNDSMSASAVNTTLVDGDSQTRIAFNNTNGTITWNGNNLNLKNFANPLKDDLVVKNAGGMIEVYNLSTQQKITLKADGTQQTVGGKLDGSSIEEFTGTAASLSSGLYINNRGLAATSSAGNDILINRQADAILNAGLGDDKIFNFAATADALNGGGGNDAVYSVGLTQAADINVSSGDGYVKLLGDMKGGTISLGGGQNYVDATGRTLTGVTVSDSSAAEASVVVAKTITGSSTVSLNAALTALDVTQLTSSTVAFGLGVNSLMADKITGTEGSRTTISSRGTNTYQVGTVTYTTFDSAGAVSDAIKATGNISDSEFSLSKGENLLDATGKTLTAVKITSAQGGNSSTTLLAGSIVGRNADKLSIIDLASGTTSGDNTISVTGSVKNADISTGAGAGTLRAGSVENVILAMGGSGSNKAQSVTIGGKANKLDYTGSNGDDTLIIKGAISNSAFDLGEGNNSLTARSDKGVNQAVSNTNITSGGSGSTTLVMGNYTYSAQGNQIELGSGSNSVTMGKISGNGTEGLTMEVRGGTATQNITVGGSANRFTYNGADGADNLTIMGAVSNSAINLGAGDNSFIAQSAKGVNQNVTNTNITAGDGSTTLVMGAYTYAASGNDITLGNGANKITVGTISGKGTEGLKIDLSAAGYRNDDLVQTLIVNGSVKNLKYVGSDGKDNITVTGAVSNSDLNLGGGDNSFTAKNAKNAYQTVSNTNITATGTGSTSIAMGNYVYGAAGNLITLGEGANSIELGSISGKGTTGLEIDLLAAQSGNQTVTIKGKANYLTYNGSNGNDTLTAKGAVSNSQINFGTGTNSFIVQNDKQVYQAVANTNISAYGTTTLKMGNYSYGVGGNEILLGNGANTIEMGSISGKGTTGLEINLEAARTGAQDVTIRGAVNRLTYAGSDGDDTLWVKGAVSNSEISLGEGTNSFTARNDKGVYQALANTNVTAGGAAASTIDVGKITYGVGGNIFSLGSGVNAITVNGSITGKGTEGLIVDLSRSIAEQQTLIINGSATSLRYEGSAADDSVSVTGSMASSFINLGAGNNSFTANGAKSTVTNTSISASGNGSNTIDITTFTAGKNGESELTLGSGDDTVNLTNTSGNVTVDMGGGANNTFTAKSLNGTTLQNGGGGTYTINTGKNATLGFTGSADALTLNIQSSLTGTQIDLGNGDVYIGSEYAEGMASTATLTSSTINAGAGLLTVDAKNITSSRINMKTENAGETGRLNLSVNGTLSAQVDLGYGENSIDANIIKNSVINRSETGGLTLGAKTVTGSTFDLTGDGSDTINVAGDLNGTLNFSGEGLDDITVGGTISGTLSNTADMVLTATKLSGLTATLSGNNIISTNTIDNSKLIMGYGTNMINDIPEILAPVEDDAEGASGETTEPVEADTNHRLNISNSTIQSGSDMALNAHNVTSSTLTMKAQEGGSATLDLSMTGTLQSSTVNLSGGDSAMNVATMKDSSVNRTEDGTLTLDAGSVSGGSLNLGGEGSDTITVTNDMNAAVTLGAGADVISVGGTIGGTLTASDNVTVTARNMSAMKAYLSGAENRLDVAELIKNSTLNLGDGNSSVGNTGTSYSGTTVSAGDGNNTILGTGYSGGSISMGNGDNDIDITESLSTTVSLGSGTNTVGRDGTSLASFKFSGTGSNTIRGTNLTSGTVSMGANGKTNELLVSGQMSNTTVTLNGGTNTVGGTGLAVSGSTITGNAAGDNTILAASLSNSKITLGESNDHVDIFGNITGSVVQLGEGVNTLRNTLAVAEAGSNITGQGSAVNNKVQNSTIQVDGGTNVFLGQVSDGTTIRGTGANNINLAGLTASTLDASGMEGGQIGIGSVKTSEITAGLGGSININSMQSGTLTDGAGQNSIIMGNLGELASINVGEAIHSTTIHVNTLDGTLNLLNDNYAGSKQGNLTLANQDYDGTVKIGGTKVTGAGTAGSTVDTSGFGLGSGVVIE